MRIEWQPKPALYKPYLRGRVREGRGVGTGVEYKSWLNPYDFASSGTMVQVQGCLVDRPFTLFSTLYEQTTFYLWERKPTTRDLRENFPILDIDFTLERCAQKGIQQKYREGYPDPFTIDLVTTEESVDGGLQDVALTVKTPQDAKNPEIRKRLEVEYEWCRDRAQLSYLLVDTAEFTQELLSALLFMRAWFELGYVSDPEREALFLDCFLGKYTRNTSLRELIIQSAKLLRLSEERATDMFRYCAWTNRIPVSLNHELSLRMPLVLQSQTEKEDG